MRMVMTVIVVAALLAAFFVPVLAMTPEPTHSNGQALEGPQATEPGQMLMMAALPGGRIIRVVQAEGKAGPMIVITVHGPGGEAVVVMPW